jgi:predicted transcriptional regulator
MAPGWLGVRVALRLMESSVTNTAGVMLTPAQLRAARALLGWSQEDLARELGGERHLSTIKRFESGKSDPKQSTLLAWRRALSKAGVKLRTDDR